jgi:Tfp pilus assembly protein PilF
LDVLGVVLYKKGEVIDAVHAFEKALTHSPEAWGTMVHLVELYRERNERAKASALVRRLRANRERLGEELIAALDELDAEGGQANG